MEIENQNLAIDSEEAADAAIEAIERPSHEPIREAQPTPQTVDEFEFTVGGKQIKAKRDQVLQWAQMGYESPNKIRALTKEVEGWKSKWGEAEPKWKEIETKYSEIDAYVRQNPQFWDHVEQSWQNRNQALQDGNNPLASVVQQLQSELGELRNWKSGLETERTQARVTQEDQAYLKEFEEIKKSYADIDFDTPDDEGKSLEYRVLEHAQKIGTNSFRAAFRDLQHDDLTNRAAAKAKETLVKDKQKQTKLGIVGMTQAPSRRPSANVRNQSYDDLAKEALEELGIR